MLEKYQSLCEERQKIIVSHDRASKNPAKHVAENPARHLVCQYCLDDKTILGDNASCCDYLVLNCEQKLAYFIDLKGVMFGKRSVNSPVRKLLWQRI